MTVKTRYTGPFFPENEPHIFMELQKRIFGPEKMIFGPEDVFLHQKMFFWTMDNHGWLTMDIHD